MLPFRWRPFEFVAAQKIAGKAAVRKAEFASDPGDPAIDRVAVAVAVPTSFSFKTVYDVAYVPRGSVRVKQFKLERNGYAGPLTVELADRQVRHLQGVSGSTLVVPAGADRFDYAVTLAPFMELLRTSRVCLMATGVIVDKDGSKHEVIYTSQAPDAQVVTLVSPPRLDISLETSSLRAEPGGEAVVDISVRRAAGLAGSIRVELVCPPHITGVSAAVVTVSPGSSSTKLVLRFASGTLGPFNMPLAIRATTLDERGDPVTAETPISLTAVE